MAGCIYSAVVPALDEFGPASVLDRVVLVPAVLVPLVVTGIFPHVLGAFAILDPALGIGAWVLHSRKT